MFDSMLYFGKVEDVKDPLEKGHVRVRVFGVHSSNPQEAPTNSLPWAPTMLPTTSPSFKGFGRSTTGLLVGSIVVVVFMDGDDDKQQPFVLGSVSTMTDGEADNPYNSLGLCDPVSTEINAYNTPDAYQAGEVTEELADSTADKDSPNYQKRPEIQRWLDTIAPSLEKTYSLPSKMLYAINWIEASGKSDAIRNAFTAEGPFQQKDAFWSEFQAGGRFASYGLVGYNRHNKEQSAKATAVYISEMRKRYGWTDERILVICYNQGEGAVSSAIKKSKSTGVDWMAYINAEGRAYWKKYTEYMTQWGRSISEVSKPDSTKLTGKNTWMDIASAEIGTLESSSGSNPKIEEYHKTGGRIAARDDIPWCASFVNYCLTKAGFKRSGNSSYGPAGALSFKEYGIEVTPRYGAIALIKTNILGGFSASGYHVGFVVKVQGDSIAILGGNQSDQVKISNFKTSDVVRYCWPSEADTSQSELESRVGNQLPTPLDCQRPQTESKYPNNHVTKTVAGHMFEVDDTPGDERIHTKHTSGSNQEYLPNGNVESKVIADKKENVLGSKYTNVQGDSFVVVKGADQTTVEGSSTEKVSGSKTITAGSNVVVDAPSLVSKNKIEAPNVITPTLTFGGKQWKLKAVYSNEVKSFVIAIS